MINSLDVHAEVDSQGWRQSTGVGRGEQQRVGDRERVQEAPPQDVGVPQRNERPGRSPLADEPVGALIPLLECFREGCREFARPSVVSALSRIEEDVMGRIVVTEFISLDGVIEAPGGGEDYKYGGWTFEVDRGDEGNQFKLDETMGSAALLLGRRTYEGFAAAWPERDGEFADKFNTMPKYVVSSTLRDPEWTNSTVLSGDLVAEVTKLKDEQDGDIVVHGSAQLVQSLIENDLVDELRLMVFPVVLGTGKRLFGETTDKKRLQLSSSTVVGDGVAVQVYTRT